MPNPFLEAAAAHSAAADEVMGEPLTLRPQAAGGDFTRGGPDPARPVVSIVGTVTRRPLEIQRYGGGADTGRNAKVAGATMTVAFAASLGLDVRPGDLVERTEAPNAGHVLRLAAALPIPGRAIHPAEEVP